MSGREATAWATFGAIAAAAAQHYVPDVSGVRWWLDSSEGIRLTQRTLTIAAAVVGVSMPWPPWRHGSWVRLMLFWIGANVGLNIVMFVGMLTIGPGNLFPLVAMIGAVFTLPAVGYGGLIGVGFRGVWEAGVRLLPR